MYKCQIRKQSDNKFLSLNPKYEKNIYLFSYLGGPGGPLCQTQVNENFRAVRPHNRADICITRGKIITASFSYTNKSKQIKQIKQNKSNLFLYNIQHNIYVYIITLLQFKIYKYNDCKCVVWTSHSHMAVFLRCPCATKQ